MNEHVQTSEILEEILREAKAETTADGKPISKELKQLIERSLQQPDWEAIKKRMKGVPKITLNPTATEIIREERDSR
ncbi:hypothetical protein [Parvularcula maris]|uniref:Uncharacterized protein n=1 Tax=Parvularcula maris TaxID=2965077 RepID=A0A9X2L7Y1_9PROT|nr:hypothetical protein [Parvularcula maris]MCQ8184746.1 hypothetical protein [Parvularcula maris]